MAGKCCMLLVGVAWLVSGVAGKCLLQQLRFLKLRPY